jgi:glycosyltransferase involved in cell wall biosynthesis
MRVAYFGFPHLGGTFQVFRHLRAGLQPLGITVQWVGLGEEAHQALAEPCWSAEMAHGFVVGARDDRPDVWARQLVRALEAARFDAVFVNVLADAVQTNLARYLPAQILRILIVHSITPATYGAARSVRDHVHAAVAISPRIQDDLVRSHGFAPERVVTIPHAAEPSAAPGLAECQPHGPLRVLYLGRIEDQSKGVLLLPRILRRLPTSVTLTVGGDGPDLKKLNWSCRAFGERVHFLGAVRYGETGQLLARHHIMVIPSRFEGFGLTLVEAMAAGCVPVASHIHGVTDWIVRDGYDGMLFPVGSSANAARRIALLDHDRVLLRSMSKAGRATARDGYGRAAMASRYRTLLEHLGADPPSIAEPLDLAHWEMPSGLRDGLRTRLPKPVKNFLRRVMESVA